MERCSTVLIILVLVLSSMFYHAMAQQPVVGGVGMSGSFYTFDGISIPAGGELNTSEAYIVVYNYIEEPIDVVLNYSAPPGISVKFLPNETNITLQPGEHRRIQVIVSVSKDTVPGTYRVSVTASRVFREKPEGVVIQPSVTQMINVTVIGEYSVIHVYALDPSGKVARNALVRLYRVVDNVLRPIIDSRNGELHARVVPGDYVVRAYLAGELVAEEKITLAPFEEKTVNLSLKIVYFEYFSIKPIIVGGELRGVKVHAVIKNVYKNITGADVVLEVARNGEVIDRRAVVRSSTLVLGRNEYEFDYIPPTGWEPGNYTFTMKVYGFGGKLLAVSPVRWLLIKPPLWMRLHLHIILPLLAALIIVWLLIRRRKRRGEERGKSNTARRR
ncbi:MAG: NEW3 domain-containing protein [Desulfurococcales archaeon]|nr:NEW3 domain-containing protein [Desulfurococcales archaeon]